MGEGIGQVGLLSASGTRTVLTAAAAAPSLHNSQPWRFRCTPNAIELHADYTRALPIADPDNRELLLGCAAALENLQLAIRSFDVFPTVSLLPNAANPGLLAVVHPLTRKSATPAERALAQAIGSRRTNRRPFSSVQIPTPAINTLRLAAKTENAWLVTLDRTQLAALRALGVQAHAAQQRDPAYVAEWRHWTGRPAEAADGVPSDSGGPLPEAHDEWVLRDFSGGQRRQRVPGKDFEARPLIAVIGSFHDLPIGQLHAGMAMQRVLLSATTMGISASFLSHLVEVPATRARLRALIGGGLWPQTVLRLGYGTPVPATPRRDLADVLLETDPAIGPTRQSSLLG
ncbi:MAG: hypothetical protein J2O49_02230 [Sciscionella sp.]|nr:hypothetical protein [Sciscionella sp.]